MNSMRNWECVEFKKDAEVGEAIDIPHTRYLAEEA